MKRVLVLGLVALSAACSPVSRIFRRPAPEVGADSLYWKAVAQLNPSKPKQSLDTALTNLERYLAGPRQSHRREALALRQLALDSKQLARVELALQQARSDTTQARTNSEAEPRRRESRDDEALLKEVQRLKEELAKANEELDRIRKRLANPKPPT